MVLPDFPDALQFIWDVFLDLSACRSDGGPISMSEMESYCRMYQVGLAGWEIGAIKQIDVCWLKAQAEEFKL